MSRVVVSSTAEPSIVDARLVRLCAAASLAYCSYAMCRSPLLPLFARELAASAPIVGLVVGASTLTGIVVKLPAGAWSDILGRRVLLLAGAAVFAVVPFSYLAVSSLGLLIALRVVHGSATAIFGPVASASLSDTAPLKPDRGGLIVRDADDDNVGDTAGDRSDLGSRGSTWSHFHGTGRLQPGCLDDVVR